MIPPEGTPHKGDHPQHCPVCFLHCRKGRPCPCEVHDSDRQGQSPAPNVMDGHWRDLQRSGLTAATAAKALLFSAPSQQVSELVGYGVCGGLVFPYWKLDGTGTTTYTRTKLDIASGDMRYAAPKGEGSHLYAVPSLLPPGALTDPAVPLWITEGEKKTLKGLQEGLGIVGVSGVYNWLTKNGKGDSLPIDDLGLIVWKGRTVYICFDADAASNKNVQLAEARLAEELRRRGATVYIVRLPGPEKGLDDYLVAHPREDLFGLLPLASLPTAVLQQRAQSILDCDDPLALVTEAILEQGYGGSTAPAKIVYVAMTTRLLAQRMGSCPCHMLIIAPSGAGKTYTESLVRGFLPPEAQHEIKAGSARALIYDSADLQHRTLVFGEADSLPSSEDNPAASAIRNLLQENELSYDVVVKDPSGKGFVTTKIRRPGPTQLVTTSTRRFRDSQLATRVFELEIPFDIEKIRAALDSQARLKNEPAPPPDPALIAFQAYLQRHAPWDIVISFAGVLSQLIGQAPTHEPRILRDFGKLLSLISAVAVIRHQRRDRDAMGRVVATLEDYETVRELAGPLYDSAVAGIGESLRQVVDAVQDGARSAKDVFEALKPGTCTLRQVQRLLKSAIKQGWLSNEETNPNKPVKPVPGDPIPARQGLPAVSAVQDILLERAATATPDPDAATNDLPDDIEEFRP
jgi:hypothetical protein